jgi:hypothetical protein
MATTYLFRYSADGILGRGIVPGPLNLDKKSLLELETKTAKDLKVKRVLFLSITPLPQDSEPVEETPDDNIRFIVNNVTTGTSQPFEYRNEAIDFYQASVADKGAGAEYELLMRLNHHAPDGV